MPYGYEEYRLANGISPNTVIHEQRLIRSMLYFIKNKYNKTVEPHEIRPIDIKDFLDNERSTGIKDTTVNRKLIYIRQWFNYMWEIGKIQVDFMPKLQYAKKLDLKITSEIHFNYVELLKVKPKLLKDPNLLLNAKLLFIFSMRGLRLRDVMSIRIDNFIDHGGTITLHAEIQSGGLIQLVFDEIEEISVLLSGIEKAVFRDTPYLFSSKVKNEYVIIRLGSIKDYRISLANYLGNPFRSEDLRFAYVHFLYKVKNMSIEEIQDKLGCSLDTTISLLKESLERMQLVDYNENINTNLIIN